MTGLNVTASQGERENLFWLDGKMYIVFHNSTWTGGEIYRVSGVSGAK